MVDSGDQRPDDHYSFTPRSHDLEILRSHPSLTDLARQRWALERLPTVSTGWAWCGAILTSLLSFGVASAAIVVVAMGVLIVLTALVVSVDDRRTARIMLRVARSVFVIWMLFNIWFAPLRTADVAPQAPPGPPPSSSTSATTGLGNAWTGPTVITAP